MSASVDNDQQVPVADSTNLDTFPVLAAGTVRPKRERRLAQSSDHGKTSPKARSARGRGRPRGRPPRRGRPPNPRTPAASAIAADDASETSDTSRGAYIHHDSGHIVQQQHGDELYCICRKPYQADKFMIGCDRCDGWFHPDCVGITTQQAMRMQLYTCPTCTSEGVAPKKKRKRGMLSVPHASNSARSYSAMMSPETLKRRMAVVRDLASRLSDDLITGPEIPALDSDIDLSSDDGAGRTGPGGRRSLLIPVLEAEFDFDDMHHLDPMDRDQQIVTRLKRLRASTEVSLQVVRLCQGLVASALSHARSRSLELRFQQLASVDFEICHRNDVCADDVVLPLVSSALCLSCKGDIPIASYGAHIDDCLDKRINDILSARCLGQSFVPALLNGFEDVWRDEDDPNGVAPSLICAYPYAMSQIDYSRLIPSSEIPAMIKFCDERRADCLAHAGWNALVTAELAQREQNLRRRARSLDAELLEVDRRIHDRQKQIECCRELASTTTSSSAAAAVPVPVDPAAPAAPVPAVGQHEYKPLIAIEML